ncbi:glutamate--cysteine ligase [Streptomyces polygonati]|uniref:Glutamate--cysteine ligase n=1 Tax=Streptomyces polygonati TaxID=1617087 RepID=A0ABV8HX45_9ACTN
MGEKVAVGAFDLADRRLYRRKLQQCLVGLERLLDEKRFERSRNLMGLEIELNLTDSDGLPRMVNEEVLRRIASRDFQTELAQFNIEVNIAPHLLSGRVLDRLAGELRAGLGYAGRMAAEVGARIVMVGILPTLEAQDLVSANLSADDRFVLLNEQILAMRGEDITLDIRGVEHLVYTSASIAPEAACTSTQMHLQVTPGRFAAVWNAAQAVAGPQVAAGANSPFLFGRELWRETRPMLFQQATDTRPQELRAQGVRPLTWFGERWIESVTDLFAENVRYFPALLPICDDEDPLRVLDDGRVPRLRELTLHNGTVYRWNRPVYEVVDGVPHLRVENRVMPAGPTVADLLANTAFYYGLVAALAEAPRPVWRRMPFGAAAANFDAACRYGIGARLHWPLGPGGALVELPAADLIRDELLPLAAAGLDSWGIDPVDRDHCLGIIGQRCEHRTNGAEWQSAVFHRMLERGLDRRPALAAMTQRYREHMEGGEPVHSWPVG